jgi:hypothetical protein
MKAMHLETCKSFREIFHGSPHALCPLGDSFHRPVGQLLSVRRPKARNF